MIVNWQTLYTSHDRLSVKVYWFKFKVMTYAAGYNYYLFTIYTLTYCSVIVIKTNAVSFALVSSLAHIIWSAVPF